MLIAPALFQALVMGIAVLALASPTTTTSLPSPDPDIDICAIPSFQWHVNSESICCPGVVDMPQGDRSLAYCCVGASIPDNVVITTTQTSCATKITLNPITEYSSKARSAAAEYKVTYTRDVGVGNFTRVETETVGGSRTTATDSTGGAGARKTAAAVLVVAGGVLLGI